MPRKSRTLRDPIPSDIVVPAGMKWCGMCQHVLSHSSFNKSKRDGLVSYCKQCESDRVTSYNLRCHGIEIDVRNLRDLNGGICDICAKPEEEGLRRHHIDHCHASLIVRGILCHGCNVGLGHFNDDPTLLRRAADYLERTPIATATAD